MFVTPVISNIENVGFVVLLGLKAAVLCILVRMQHLQKWAEFILHNYSVLFISKQTCSMFEIIVEHDHFGNASASTMANLCR